MRPPCWRRCKQARRPAQPPWVHAVLSRRTLSSAEPRGCALRHGSTDSPGPWEWPDPGRPKLANGQEAVPKRPLAHPDRIPSPAGGLRRSKSSRSPPLALQIPTRKTGPQWNRAPPAAILAKSGKTLGGGWTRRRRRSSRSGCGDGRPGRAAFLVVLQMPLDKLRKESAHDVRSDRSC